MQEANRLRLTEVDHTTLALGKVAIALALEQATLQQKDTNESVREERLPPQ